jgi:hypothetical protein
VYETVRRKVKAMRKSVKTVKELRDVLAGLPDNMPINFGDERGIILDIDYGKPMVDVTSKFFPVYPDSTDSTYLLEPYEKRAIL